MAVMKRFKGRLLPADESPLVLEGTWNRDKVVLLLFPDEASFREWADQEIAKDRKAGAAARNQIGANPPAPQKPHII